jgi:hypothetical protein
VRQLALFCLSQLDMAVVQNTRAQYKSSLKSKQTEWKNIVFDIILHSPPNFWQNIYSVIISNTKRDQDGT